jgi:hypothetical protein
MKQCLAFAVFVDVVICSLLGMLAKRMYHAFSSWTFVSCLNAFNRDECGKLMIQPELRSSLYAVGDRIQRHMAI